MKWIYMNQGFNNTIICNPKFGMTVGSCSDLQVGVTALDTNPGIAEYLERAVYSLKFLYP